MGSLLAVSKAIAQLVSEAEALSRAPSPVPASLPDRLRYPKVAKLKAIPQLNKIVLDERGQPERQIRLPLSGKVMRRLQAAESHNARVAYAHRRFSMALERCRLTLDQCANALATALKPAEQRVLADALAALEVEHAVPGPDPLGLPVTDEARSLRSNRLRALSALSAKILSVWQADQRVLAAAPVKRKSLGRPKPAKGTIASDAKLYRDWECSPAATYAEFAKLTGRNPTEVKRGIERHRKRVGTPKE
jgi:hypothetical protein